jgi:hypothetical protein
MADDDELQSATPRMRRLRFEGIFAVAWIGFGALILPALIYFVGTRLLGPYNKGAGLDALYADLFVDLAHGSGRAWLVVLGPWVGITLLRVVLFGFRRRRAAVPESESRKRLEPFVD